MKTLIATLLATAAGASFAAPTAALNHDATAYREATQKSTADYQQAVAKCDALKGNDNEICMAEAKVVRTRAESNALAKYINTPARRERARTMLADDEYALAKERCDDKSGADKDACMNNAKSVRAAAVADAKADRTAAASGASGAGATASGGLVSGTDTRDPAKAAAVDKCAQAGTDAKTGCLIDTKPSPLRENAAAVADRTEAAAGNAADKTRAAAATAVDKTKEVAQTAVEKTRQVASTVAQKTETTVDRAGDATRQAAAGPVAAKARVAATDTALTTKVKAGLLKEPKLESLGIHVETEKGVVMLSGFVNSKDEAERALKVAQGVDGVANVKNAIQVK
ncbi:BON domain-containing protein [Massilia forsythiae]|uniref:BON domain-containing protein n=1 Tax=Massilia forsythiae TaxID=2728020 RepID=A0A7Z2ZSS8_9BURK|nr:BON domain-containing protein [Massilia forsythiae]QJE00823.1 BON domain-containing protein [Massilia forsythiae]